MLFLGNDVIVDLTQLGFALMGAGAVACLGRLAGLKPPGAVVAGSLFFLTPIVLVQAKTAYVDVALASMFLLSFYFSYRYATGYTKTSFPYLLYGHHLRNKIFPLTAGERALFYQQLANLDIQYFLTSRGSSAEVLLKDNPLSFKPYFQYGDYIVYSRISSR